MFTMRAMLSRLRLILLSLLALFLVDGRLHGLAAPGPHVLAKMPRLPLRFEANAGQWNDTSVHFAARRHGATLALRDEGATLALRRGAKRTVLTYGVDQARPTAPLASNELVTKTNYFVGNEPAKWRTDIPNYGRVTYPSVLDKVDLVYHGEDGQIEYDFVVQPGGDVDAIAMNVGGAQDLSLAENGDLVIHTDTGNIVQPRPYVYQADGNAKRTIRASYRLTGASKVGFEVASYDRARPLVIDPVLIAATYLGGDDEEHITSVAVDSGNNVYVTGDTNSTDFAVKSAFDDTFSDSTEAFVSKLDSTLSNLLYSTYLGGANSSDFGKGIAVDSGGNAYIAGITNSADFPTTTGAFNQNFFDASDGFVTKLGPGGNTLSYSTFLRGTGTTAANGIAVDGNGQAYVVGTTAFPDVGSQISEKNGVSQDFVQVSVDAFVVKLAADGKSLVYPVKYIGGSGTDKGNAIAIDGSGNAFVVGQTGSSDLPVTPSAFQATLNAQSLDAFAAKLDSAGSTLSYLTYLGSAANDEAFGVAVNAGGEAAVVGYTDGTFPVSGNAAQPTSNGGEEGFLVRLNAGGTGLSYGTHLGGLSSDRAFGVAYDALGGILVVGRTSSPNFPTKVAIRTTGSGEEGFAQRYDASGVLSFSSLLGGESHDTANAVVATSSTVVIAGSSFSTTLPTSPTAFQKNFEAASEGFIVVVSFQPLIITPATASSATGGFIQFSASGGSGTGYTFTLQSSQSGATITQAGGYTAGNVGGTTDTVVVTDSQGATATASVSVLVGGGGTTLVINPINHQTPPKGVKQFSATGGQGPYTFSLQTNNSGGSITPTGLYTAGPKGNVTDIVRVIDTFNTVKTATVNVGAALTITPAKPAVAPRESLTFSVTGGSGLNYEWSITKNGSGGTIDLQGHYAAGAGTNTSDTVQVKDSFGNTATVVISVGGGLAVDPGEASVTTKGSVTFTAAGGSGSYTWSLQTNASGGSINPTTGVYTAGTTGNVKDVVKVTDTLNNSTTVEVTVGPALTISPTETSVDSEKTVPFIAAGGSGTGYTFRLVENASGAKIDEGSGVYTAGTKGGRDVVEVTDSLGNTARGTVNANKAPPPPPPAASGSNNPPPNTNPGSSNGGPQVIVGGEDSGCGCREASSNGSSSSTRLIGMLAIGALFIARRRRKH